MYELSKKKAYVQCERLPVSEKSSRLHRKLKSQSCLLLRPFPSIYVGHHVFAFGAGLASLF